MPVKKCTGCGEVKDLSEYPPDRRVPDGKQSRCRRCISEWMKQHQRNNPVWYMLRRAKSRAVRKGWEFGLEPTDLTPLPDTCPVLGIEVRVGQFPQDPQAYSLDRVDNERGYTSDNVVVMSYLANRLKNNGTAEQHEQIAKWMREHEAKVCN